MHAILAHATYGNAALARTGADGDTLETLSDQLDAVVTSGPGASEQDITITDDSDAPIADADVWITSDAAGATVVYGTFQTGSDGKPTTQPLLDAGVTFYLWMQKDGVNPISGEAFVAE